MDDTSTHSPRIAFGMYALTVFMAAKAYGRVDKRKLAELVERANEQVPDEVDVLAAVTRFTGQCGPDASAEDISVAGHEFGEFLGAWSKQVADDAVAIEGALDNAGQLGPMFREHSTPREPEPSPPRARPRKNKPQSSLPAPVYDWQRRADTGEPDDWG